ncbi:hypothetical protein ACFL0O_11520 [Thermodesulfobacteriota bacterium]
MKLKTIEERRKTDRERLKRWRKSKLAAGNKQVQLMLSPEAQAVLQEEKERTGEPFVSLIHRAIIGLKDVSTQIPMKEPAESEGALRTVRDFIFEMDGEGKDEWEISAVLNDKGVQTFDDKEKWYPSSVRSILKQKNKHS